MRDRFSVRWAAVGLFGALLALPAGPVGAQIDTNLGAYTGKNAEGYLKPLQEGFGAALQDAVFRNASIPRAGLHVNVEVKTMFTKFGDEDRTFIAETEEGFFPAGTTAEVPTVIGDTEAVQVDGDNGTTAYFPGGLDIGSLGIAVPQVTVGGIMGTQAIVRYIAFDTGDAEVGDLSLIGFGLRHSISQYLVASPVAVAAGFFWQHFELGDDLVKATALSFGAQASKSFGMIEPYLGLSYDSFSMSAKWYSEVADERLDVDFDDENNLHITGGIGLNFALLHLHGEINSSSQTSFALGLSVGN